MTPIRSTDDVIQFLVGRHEQIKAQFSDVLGLSEKAWEQAFFDLRRLLAIHQAAEEEAVHSRVRRDLDDGEPLVEDRLDEEHEAKVALAELDVDSDGFTRKITELRSAVLRHAQHEEDEEFDRLRSPPEESFAMSMGEPKRAFRVNTLWW